jgi:hypothetical protein
MRWHLLDDAGRIVRTTDAPDKPTAATRLGPGPIVSDASYRAAPARAIPTPVVKGQRKGNGHASLPTLPSGHLYTEQVAKLIGVSRQRLLSYAKGLGLTATRQTSTAGARLRYVWTPEQVAALTDRHRWYHSPERRAESAAKRRRSYLLTCSHRYAARIAARRLQWQAKQSSRTSSASASASSSAS